MKRVGHIAELWRYPVSSLGGEPCQSVDVCSIGISGDREFGLFDPLTGRVAAPEKESRWRPALFLQGGIDDKSGTNITFPDKATFGVEDPDLPSRLFEHFGFDVAIGRYRNDLEGFGRSLPLISNRYIPSALHLLTQATINKLQDLTPSSDVSRLRFRPSVYLSTAELEGFVEDSWIGSTLRLGEVPVTVSERTARCGMTFIKIPLYEEQPEILRTVVRQNERKLGVYCDPTGQGRLNVGDDVLLFS